MTIIDFGRPRIAAAEHESGLVGWCRKVLADAKARRQKREMRVLLSEMDAYMLRDIGIEPMDVWEMGRGKASSVLFYPIRKPDPPL